MSRRISHSNIAYALVTAVSVMLIILAAIATRAVKSDNAQPVAVVMIAQPMTAQDVCIQLHGTGFQDKFHRGGWPTITDLGYCTISGVKYGVNVFTGAQERADWLKIAANVGVVPKWETGTAVVYKSVRLYPENDRRGSPAESPGSVPE